MGRDGLRRDGLRRDGLRRDNWMPSAMTCKVQATRLFAIIATGLTLTLANHAVGAPAGNQCFAPADLAAKPGEERPQRGDRRFDAPEPARNLAPFAPLPAGFRGAIRRVDLPPGSRKLVALTLDLCEQPGEVSGYDGRVFDLLRGERVKATLFIGGKWMRSHEGRFSQLLADPLFEVANHASGHRNLRLLSGRALADEIDGPQRAYEAVRERLAGDQCLAPQVARTPPRIGLFRFPYGACNDASLTAVNDRGLMAIQWDVSTGDPWPGQSADAIAQSMIRGVRPGSIVIAHANGRGFNTAAGLPAAIAALKAKGYEFVTVSELLAAGKPVITPTCYNVKPGDTDRYDRPLALTPRAPGLPGANSLPAVKAAPVEKLPWQ